MTENLDEVARLRRIAYGPGAMPDERAVAKESLQEFDDRPSAEESLRELGDRPKVETSASHIVPVPEALQSEVPLGVIDESSEHTIDDGEQNTDQSWWRRSIRVGWLVPVAVGALFLGGVGALGATGQFTSAEVKVLPTTPPTASPVAGARGNLMIPGNGAGNVDAANAFFVAPAQSYEAYPLTSLLDKMGVDQSQVRLAVADGRHKLWVVRMGTVGFCLAIYDVPSSQGSYECAPIEDFKKSGVKIITTDFAAWWGGTSFVMAG